MQNKFLFFSSEVENTTICNSISAQNGAIRCTCGAGLRLRRNLSTQISRYQEVQEYILPF